MTKPKKDGYLPDGGSLSNENPFAEVARSLGFDALPPVVESEADKVIEPSLDDFVIAIRGCSVVMRVERKGRGGKTVTVLDGFSIGGEAMAILAKELRKAMGCGSSVEGSSLILQGDNRDRIASWLGTRGVRVKW